MGLPWGLLILLIGLAWGLACAGRERTRRRTLNSAVVGSMLSLVFAILGHAIQENPLGVGGTLGASALAFALLAPMFALGAWVGDTIEQSARQETV